MAAVDPFPAIRSSDILLDPAGLGRLEESTDLLGDGPALRQRMARDGYLFCRAVLDVQEVTAARASICRKLAADGLLEPSQPEIEAVWRKDAKRVAFKPEYAFGNPSVERLLYGPRMLGFFRTLLDGPVAHYDYTWLRAVAPGPGTPGHCDVVYMGRGETSRLFTAWTPLGDVGFDAGGLMILEGSHLNQPLRETYGKHDVDTHCSNKEGGDGWGDEFEWIKGTRGYSGSLGKDCNAIRSGLGCARWLTAEFKAGDILVFSMYTIHASMDNHSDRVRLSTDSRYQPIGTRMDERWIGENPPAHGQAAKRGRIC